MNPAPCRAPNHRSGTTCKTCRLVHDTVCAKSLALPDRPIRWGQTLWYSGKTDADFSLGIVAPPALLEKCRARSRVSSPSAHTVGSLREYIGHLCYKWLNYYVRMSKDVVWDPHERFPLGFSRWPHSVGGAECCRHSKPREKRSWGSQTTSTASSRRPSAARRRHSVGAP